MAAVSTASPARAWTDWSTTSWSGTGAAAANRSVGAWGTTQSLRPFDLNNEVREYFLERLPAGWFIATPERTSTGYDIDFHVPKDWRGNPVSAARAYCPARENVVWRYIERIYIIPYYRDQRWASVECRA